MNEKKNKTRMLYLIPEPSCKGGMTAISKMYYEVGLFQNPDIMHFNTSFNSNFAFFRIVESLWKKLHFVYLLAIFRPQVIYVMTSSFWGFYDKCVYCLIARLFNVRSILNPVGGGFIAFYEGNKFHMFLVNMMIKAPSAILVGSSFWESYFRKHFSHSYIVNSPNPVNTLLYEKAELKRKQDRFLVVSISSIIYDKGIRELAAVIDRVCKETGYIDFEIIGDGDKRLWLTQELQSWIEAGRVKISGFVSDESKQASLKNADLFIMLSYFELIPISILEAMASSLPILATRVGGIPDLVENYVNGFLFEKHEIEQVVQKVIWFANLNQQTFLKFSVNSLTKVLENYDVHSVLHKHHLLAESLINLDSRKS